MLAHANRITVPGVSLDVVGTGGDRAHTVNISTMAAMVCAAAGVRVVKHGNRAASSSSGSADVLEALGIDLGLRPVAGGGGRRGGGHHVLLRAGLPPGLPARRRRRGGSWASATAFNFLGPLTNPAQPTYAAVGVADARMAPIVAGVFASRGRDAAVFRGDDGLDELTVWRRRRRCGGCAAGSVTSRVAGPDPVGAVELQPTSALRGGDPAYNAGVVRSSVRRGERGRSATRCCSTRGWRWR